MLVLICTKDPGVPRIQPYRLGPKGVPGQHPLRAAVNGAQKRSDVLNSGVSPKAPTITLCS